MLGASLTIPVNSPLLRRSTSRTVVSELGSGEPVLVSDESSLVVAEAVDQMKAGSSPKQASSAVPSAGPLWRVKGPFFLLWGFICCKIGMDSVMRMDAKLRNLFLYEAFLYYNPLLLVAMMIWLWGVNIWVFSQSSVNYAKIFDLDHNHLTHKEIWKVLLYTILALILVFPFDIFYVSSRYYFLRTLWRLIFPLQPITFADFFLADVLTSMAKVATIAWFEADAIRGSHSILLVFLLFLMFAAFSNAFDNIKTPEKSPAS